jgi:8-oxo-dGTP diphosphatase
MAIFVVRHAKAGERASWDGDDTVRPLSKRGWAQATAIADRLQAAPISRILASPYLRCIQTVEPLAERIGLPVEVAGPLAEGSAFEATLDLFASVPEYAVLCSHGDVIPDLVHALVRRGMEIAGPADWRKGVIWVVERDAEGDALRAYAVPPLGG